LLIHNELNIRRKSLIQKGIDIYTIFLHNKNNGLQQYQAPSPAGEGWGEEINIKHLYSPHPNLLPLEKEQ